MDIVCKVGDFLQLLGLIILVIEFIRLKNDFNNLSYLQKKGLIMMSIGISISMSIGFIEGFSSCAATL